MFPWGALTLGVWKSSVLFLTLLPNHKKECIDLFCQTNNKAKVQKDTEQLHEEIFCGGIATSKTLNTD